MKPAPRAILALSLPCVLLLLALAFPRFVLQSIVLPTATVLWLLLRIFILSIDQEVYWWGAIMLPVFVVLVALFRPSGDGTFHQQPRSSAPWDPARRWRDLLRLNVHTEPHKDTFRKDLAWLLTSLHASARPGCARYQIREAFLQGSIPLPPSVYAFLFSSTRPPDPAPAFISHPVARLRRTFGSLGLAFQRRTRRRSGREAADYFHSIDEVLSFMETSLEMTNEHEPDSSSRHRARPENGA